MRDIDNNSSKTNYQPALDQEAAFFLDCYGNKVHVHDIVILAQRHGNIADLMQARVLEIGTTSASGWQTTPSRISAARLQYTHENGKPVRSKTVGLVKEGLMKCVLLRTHTLATVSPLPTRVDL